jgi:hypothetical protein
MTKPYRAIALVSLLLSLRVCVAADSPATEAWHVYVDKQVPYGSEHVVKRSLANGDVEYRVETRVLIDLLGTRQEESTTATYVFRPALAFRPVSMQVNINRPSGTVEVTGAVEGDRFVMRREANGLKRSAVIDLRQRPIFRAALPDALGRLESTAEATETALVVIDDEFLTVEPAKCRKIKGTDPSTTVWRVEIGGDPVLAMGHLSLKGGERMQEDFAFPRYIMRRGSRQEAEQIQHRKLEGRDILMFDVGQPIARLDQLQELTVKLRWKDLPPDGLHLSDARQALVSHRAEGSQHEAVVRIARPEPSAPPAVDVLPRNDREALLGKTRFIDPADPDIVSKAAEWTKDAKTQLDAVTALAENVFQHLRGGELIAETLSGPEVLKCRKGKCSEYAVLFASLARARNIPTRIVLGDRMVGGQWVGHMWNEAFVEEGETVHGAEQRTGRWTTVDATAREIGFAPGLLKFTHAASVDGTQSVRWGLTDSLELSITNYKLKPENASDAWKTGVADNTYTSAEFGFRVATPNKDWKMTPELKAGQLVLRLHVPGAERMQIHCVAFSLPVALDAKTMMSIRSTRYRATYKDYTVLADKTEAINGRDWQTLHFSRGLGPVESKQFPDSKSMKTSEYAFHRGTVGYLINLIAADSAHDKHKDQLLAILKTVVFKEGTPANGPEGIAPDVKK